MRYKFVRDIYNLQETKSLKKNTIKLFQVFDKNNNTSILYFAKEMKKIRKKMFGVSNLFERIYSLFESNN